MLSKTIQIISLALTLGLFSCGGGGSTAVKDSTSTQQADLAAETEAATSAHEAALQPQISEELKALFTRYPYLENKAFVERVKKANPDGGDYGEIELTAEECRLLEVGGEVSTYAIACTQSMEYTVYVTIEQGHFDYMVFHILSPNGKLESLGQVCGGTGSAARGEPNCSYLSELSVTDESINYTVVDFDGGNPKSFSHKFGDPVP
ncbi:MAG: hypothetical protein EAZ57_05110 [Cytophagales bacterium]|nr:MAG: hypothetical protein EAZ67_06470 [Cytophagales bacterium]TAF60931.1 MAG: hypothetical protein EAZ57_05110 [Cytophagales bacterium]